MTQTAVEQLVNYMKENFHLTDEALQKFEQAKQMEKEQMKFAWIDGNNTIPVCDIEAEDCFNDYYRPIYMK